MARRAVSGLAATLGYLILNIFARDVKSISGISFQLVEQENDRLEAYPTFTVEQENDRLEAYPTFTNPSLIKSTYQAYSINARQVGAAQL